MSQIVRMPNGLKIAFEDMFQSLLPTDDVSKYSSEARQAAAAKIQEAEASGNSLFGQYAASDFKVTQEGFSTFLEQFLSEKTGICRA